MSGEEYSSTGVAVGLAGAALEEVFGSSLTGAALVGLAAGVSASLVDLGVVSMFFESMPPERMGPTSMLFFSCLRTVFLLGGPVKSPAVHASLMAWHLVCHSLQPLLPVMGAASKHFSACCQHSSPDAQQPFSVV
jgi:hypothetical protein